MRTRRRFLQSAAAVALGAPLLRSQSLMPRFASVQPELFSAPGAQCNCWADFDNDGDPDLFVSFKAAIPNRLYRNDSGVFVEVGAAAGLADLADTRGAAWGDFDSDGHFDLYTGFSRRANTPNKLYRNEGSGKFVDVAHDLGVAVIGETRQISWIDFDNDGRMDLFVAMRDGPNMLFHNEGHKFIDVAKDLGVADPRKTVGAVWFDYNRSGRLSVFTANQDGTLNGLFHNEGNKFVDVARELNVDAASRPATYGSCGPSVIDFNNDGHLDFFIAGYGENFLYRNDGAGKFSNVAAAMGVAGGDEATPSAWGDYDNDGRPDLYVSSYIQKPLNEHDYLYRNTGTRFAEVTPWEMLKTSATHGLQWADFDGNGALDLAIANNNPNGTHTLWRNLLAPEQAQRSLQVLVLDQQGRYTRAGAEVRIYKAGTRQVLGTRIVDTGSGYCSQNVMPVHFGLSEASPVDVEVTTLTAKGRTVTKVANVDPTKVTHKTLIVKAD